ncbi:MAG: DNA repair protein RecN [Candidatus Aminicenantes bacterium]|nr:DNA repair protein RecN [Candidatus Aminicenantes bacterium]
MIKSLRIQNLATIEDIELQFQDGFSILTGETGTGKSIIIGGLKLILGEKGSTDIIRTGKEETSIEAIFQSETQEDVLIHRRISEQGPGKGYLNGTLVPIKKLKETGRDLVDIYGQNDHIFLREPEYQLDYLDIFAGLLPLRETVARLARETRRLQREKKELVSKEKEREQRLDFLEFQIKEIESAGLDSDEEEGMRQERNILKNSERIRTHIEDALLIASSSDRSLCTQLSKLQHSVNCLLDFGKEFKEVYEEINQFSVTISEFTDFLIKFKEKNTASPEKLNTIEERLSTIEKLKRKYGTSIQEILSFFDRAKNEQKDLESNHEKLQDLTVQINNHFTAYKKEASQLTHLRQIHARQLEDKIKNEISVLGMKKAEFRIDFRTFPYNEESIERIKDKGNEEIDFLISPNPGEELRPLRRIASGGELSRIMLALKSIGKDTDKNKTLIFDEIDAGIGGKTAEFVAQKLKALSKYNQVICITHLPQIASFAAHHYKIEKTISQNRTFTTTSKLNAEERVEEISRLFAGSHITPTTLKNAREMLEHNQREEEF